MFTDQYQTDESMLVTYTDPSWDAKYYVKFREQKSIKDDRRLEAITKELRNEDDELASTVAFIYGMAVRWNLVLPKGYKQPVKDAAGQIVKDEKGTVQLEAHPYAGKIMPLEPESIRMLPGSVLIRMLNFAQEQYALRGKEEQEAFRGEAV